MLQVSEERKFHVKRHRENINLSPNIFLKIFRFPQRKNSKHDIDKISKKIPECEQSLKKP